MSLVYNGRMSAVQLSASTLKIFQECPRCFWLHITRRIERPRGPFPSLPSGIDRVLKGYFDVYRKAGRLPPLIDGKLPGTLATSALTLGFTDPGVQARLWGKLDDCVILPDRRVAPLDHKTRASAPDGVGYTEKYYQFQMDVYTLLLERNGQRTSRTAYVVYYCPVDGELHLGFPFQVTIHTIATDPDRAYGVFTDACRCLAGPLPDSGERCEFCRWAEARQARLPARPARLPEEQARLAARPARLPARPAHLAARQARGLPMPQAATPPPVSSAIPDDLFA